MNNRYAFKGANMLSRIATALAILCMTGLAIADNHEQTSTNWTAKDFAGNEVVFPEVLEGKPTVLVFWATWCPYCRAFMPYLGEIHEEYGDTINILTVDVFEDGKRDPAEHIESLDFPMIAVAEGDPVAKLYGVVGTPGIMVLNGDGSLAWKRASTDLPAGKKVSEFWAGQLREQLDQLL